MLAADQIIKAIGQNRPNLASRLGLEQENGYIRVNDDLETSLPGVFAVGDVRGGNIKRVASAVGEGSIAVAFVHQVLRE